MHIYDCVENDTRYKKVMMKIQRKNQQYQCLAVPMFVFGVKLNDEARDGFDKKFNTSALSSSLYLKIVNLI